MFHKGIIATLAIICILARPVQAAELCSAEKDMLMRIAMAEAEGEDVKGKAAVMEVVLNRVKDDGYPGTVQEVLFQNGQFSTVAKGGRYWTVVPNEECAMALVLVEGNIDFANGALFFSNGKSWLDTEKTFMFQLGNHKFFK